MAEKNSLWKNIRKKAEQNRRTGNKPKEPTKEMLRQEKNIKAQYAVGGTVEEESILYRKPSVPMESAELAEREDYTPYRPSSAPMENYEPDVSFYTTPSKSKSQSENQTKKPNTKKPTSKRSDLQNSFTSRPILYLTPAELGGREKMQPSTTATNVPNIARVKRDPIERPDVYVEQARRYQAELEAETKRQLDFIHYGEEEPSRLLEGIARQKAEKILEQEYSPVNDLDVATDIMQLGNFVPHPVFQAIGKIGSFGGAATDLYQADEALSKGNYGDMAINLTSAGLGAYLGGKGRGYTRDMNNTVPGSMADKIANLGSRSGTYRPLTATPNLRNNDVIKRGLNYNRGILGTLGAETIYDSKAQGGPFNPDGGTYANKHGVIMGPVENPDGSYKLPFSNEGLPQVNLPEFEVALESNPYGPVTGEEYLESNFNPINWILPSVEPYQQQFRPDGTLIPASGRVAPVYPEAALLPAKLPINASTKLGKAGANILEFAIDNPGLGVGSLVKNVGKKVEKYGKRALRSNYNPLSIPVKNIGTRIARISDSQYRDFEQILEALKGKSSSSYFGHHGDYGDIIYGPNHRDLNKTYFKGNKTGLKKLEYDTSKDLGLKSSEDWYGKLDAYELNSEIPNNEKLDIIDFLKSMNNYQWNEADGFKTGQYVLSEGIKDLMKDYPGENLLDLGKLTGGKKIGLETFNDEQLKIVKDNLRHLFEKYGSDKIPFEIGKTNPSTKGDLYPEYKGIQLFGSPIKPIDDIAGHMGFLERNPVTGDINYTTRDVWGFNPKAYSQRYATTRIGDEIKPFEKLQIHLMDAFGKPFILHQTNPIKFKDGGPMQYKVGGQIPQKALSTFYGIAGTGLNALTFGATKGIIDQGYNALQKAANPDFDPTNPNDVNAIQDINKFRSFGMGIGAFGTAVTGNFAGATAGFTEAANTFVQNTDVPDDIKKGAGALSSIGSFGYGVSKIGSGPEGLEAINKIAPFANQAIGSFGGQSLAEKGQDTQDYLQSAAYLNSKAKSNQQYVNQGLSFAASGGPVNNNLLTLQTGSMRKNINNYRRKYKEGGQVDVNDKLTQFGLHKIQNGGKHWQNPKDGVIVGNASVEEDEVLKFAEGGSANLSNAEYVYPDTVNDEFTLPMYKPNESLTDFELDKDGNPIPLDMTPAEFLIKEGTKGSPFRKINTLAKIRMNNAEAITRKARDLGMAINEQNQQNQQMMVEGALQYAAAGGKLNKDIDIEKTVMEEYVAAYGGKLPNKYKGKVNMPSMKAKGGPMVSNIKQPFEVAAQNRGGMMMAQGGMMQQQGGQDQMMQVVQQVAQAIMQGADPRKIMQELMRSGMPEEQVQQVVQVAMQEVEGQQQSMQGQQIPPQQSMAMGGTMYKEGGSPYPPIINIGKNFDNILSDFNHGRRMLFNKYYRNAYRGANNVNVIPNQHYEAPSMDPIENAKKNSNSNPSTPDAAVGAKALGTGNEDIFGNDTLGKALAIGQAAIPLAESAYHIFNKPDYIKDPVVQSATFDYSKSRRVDERQTDMAENAYLNALKGFSSTSGIFASNAKEYLLRSNAAQAGRNALSIENEINKTAEEVARTNALDAQYRFNTDQLNYDIDQARLGNIFGSLNNAGTTTMQGYNDIANRKIQEIQARSTKSANVTPVTGADGIVYMATKGADGYYFNGVKIAELPK